MVKRKISAAQRAILINRLKKARAAKKRKSAPTRKSSSSKRRYTNMVKRKAPVRRRSRKRAGNLSGVMATGVGIGGYILFESMIEPRLIAMANISNPLIINAVELMGGLYLSKKSGVLGNVGKAAVVVNLYQLLHPYLSGVGRPAASGVGLFS